MAALGVAPTPAGGVTPQDLTVGQGGQVRLSITDKKGHAFDPGNGNPVFWYVLAADANSDDSDSDAWRGRGPASVTTDFLSPGSYRVAARAYGGWRDPKSRIVTVTPGSQTVVRISITKRQLDVDARALTANKVAVTAYGPESGYRVQGQRLQGGRWTNVGKARNMRGSDARNFAVSQMTWSHDGYLTNYRFVVTVKGSAKTSIAFVHAMDLVNDPWN